MYTLTIIALHRFHPDFYNPNLYIRIQLEYPLQRMNPIQVKYMIQLEYNSQLIIISPFYLITFIPSLFLLLSIYQLNFIDLYLLYFVTTPVHYYILSKYTPEIICELSS